MRKETHCQALSSIFAWGFSWIVQASEGSHSFVSCPCARSPVVLNQQSAIFFQRKAIGIDHPGTLLSSIVEGRPTGEPNRFRSFDSSSLSDLSSTAADDSGFRPPNRRETGSRGR